MRSRGRQPESGNQISTQPSGATERRGSSSSSSDDSQHHESSPRLAASRVIASTRSITSHRLDSQHHESSPRLAASRVIASTRSITSHRLDSQHHESSPRLAASRVIASTRSITSHRLDSQHHESSPRLAASRVIASTRSITSHRLDSQHHESSPRLAASRVIASTRSITSHRLDSLRSSKLARRAFARIPFRAASPSQMATSRRAVTQGRSGNLKLSTAGLLPVLLLALLLPAPPASARRWFWNDALFPVAPAGETKPSAALYAAESDGAAAGAAAAPAPAAPAPAAPAPAPAPAETCDDAPLDPFVASRAAPDPCAKLAAELTRSAGELGNKTGGTGFAAPSLFRACHSTFLFRKKCDGADLQSIANAFDNHYVYKHIAVDSPDQTNLPSSIDIVADLRKIVANGEKGKYARLVDAHMAAYRATLAPRRYVTPKGMRHVAKTLHSFEFDLYEGRQVVGINWEKAEDFILNWADKNVGSFRNRAARFTKSFARNEAEGTLKGTSIVQVYLVGGNTAVVWIHQFLPSDAVSKALAEKKVNAEKYMVQEVAKALQTAAASNASQIIIDVRGNGGGYTTAAYTAIRLLMGAAKVPDSEFTLPLDFIIGTQYTENAISLLSIDPATQYCIGVYADLNGTDLSSALHFAPIRELRFTEAGRAGNYSALLKQNKKFTGKEQQPVLGDRPFLVLSDGNCFSSCGILTHVLGKRHKVPMVTVGGLPNQPPDVGSSCLGFTEHNIYSMAPGLTKLAALMPQNASLPLKVKGAVGMAFANGYVDSEIPCEFEFLPSQHHINYTVDLIDKPWAMWSEVAKLFASAAA
ncbi:unnamed protein product [Closterium sp. Naga37s-1]|nr:unnamed protein product [Closterium sp. Naga37s-1]